MINSIVFRQIEFKNIVKNFGPVRVLNGVSFSLDAGRVYGLLGENGAGKSTLMKILSGYESASGGEILINNESVCFTDSRAAQDMGIVLIHQEFNLADDLTIAQNIFLGHEKKRGWVLDDKTMRSEAANALKKVGLYLNPDTKVRDLIVAEKQMVEVAKALARNAKLLIMDEPTATLTPNETQHLFNLIKALHADGVTIIYISHKLDEVEYITDEVIIMRDGHFITRELTVNVNRKAMANLMVGRELSDLYPVKTVPPAGQENLLSIRNFNVPHWAHSIDFDIKAGEILGFSGLVGAGRTELFEGILGLRHSTGDIYLKNKKITLKHPEEAVKHGISYLSEDRKGKGLHIKFGLYQNLTLMALERYAHPWLHPQKEKQALKEAIDAFGIRTGGTQHKNIFNLLAGSLSGGNQQKLALAKVLHPNPQVVILDEPTRGVDVGAKRDIYFLIQALAQKGLAVIVISSELMELIGLCHRVAVMRHGHLQTVLQADQLNEQELIAYATGTH